MDALFNFLSEYGWFIGPPLAILIVVAWVYRSSARARYRSDSKIPFDD